MARNPERAERPAQDSNSPDVHDEIPALAKEKALAEENLRRAREISAHARRSPVGPLGRTALLIGLLALAGLLFVWLLLVI
jgi:hypothetical protein